MTMLQALLRSLTPAASPDDLTPTEAHARGRDGAILLDVRETDEWQSGHAAGAKHIPLGQLRARLSSLRRDREIVTICLSGNRSGRAAAELRRAGFTDVRNMAGGMVAWTRAGLPVQR
jgi:rhodanese-related sulfurtransferase